MNNRVTQKHKERLARLHHAQRVLRRANRRINKRARVLARDDMRGLRGVCIDLRREALSNSFVGAILALALGFLVSLVLWTYYVWLWDLTAIKHRVIVLLYLAIPGGYLFSVVTWLFFVDTDSISYRDRLSSITDAFITAYRGNAALALAQVEDAYQVVSLKSKWLSSTLGVGGLGLLLNAIAAADFQRAIWNRGLSDAWGQNPLGSVLLVTVPVAFVAYSGVYGFYLSWFTALKAELRLRFSRLNDNP